MAFDTKHYLDFFKTELKENLLFFWMPRCLDTEFGGYFNCFTNDGSRLVSKDKYVWSQGRFLWTFSKLATMDMFSEQERSEFLHYAKSGRDFLIKNVLIAKDDWRCVFLTEQNGTPKYVNGYRELDMSISADCFVVAGFAMYSIAANDYESYIFAKKLGESVWERYNSGNYRSLPYPLSPKFDSHARPMILTNVNCELYRAALVFEPEYANEILKNIDYCHTLDFERFCDENSLIHEFTYANGEWANNLFGQHINPGHTIEDMWFQYDAQCILNTKKYWDKIQSVVKKTFNTGWDNEFGGLLHFIGVDGTMEGCDGDAKDESQLKLVKDDWGSKLWWVHSEALYTTLLMFDKTNDSEFLDMFQKVFDYTYKTFPNPDKNIREWIQIRTRDGSPQDKVVALPVKDPYHIMRNVILIIELLTERYKNER